MPHGPRFMKLAADAKAHVKEVTVDEARQRQEAGSMLIDVREAEEFEKEHAAGAGWTLRRQALAAESCGSSCRNSRIRSAVLWPPTRQRLSSTVRQPLAIRPQTEVNTSSPAPARLSATSAGV